VSLAPVAVRSLLFVPGHRPDMIAKVGRWQPDAVAVDLEDAVPAADKLGARPVALRAIETLDAAGTMRFLRVNPVGSPWFAGDAAAAGGSGVDGVILPKFETVDQLDALHDALAASGRSDVAVIVGLETAQGVADARTLLGAGVSAAYFGAEDFIADVGGARSVAGLEVLYARSQVALFARLAGVTVIDQAVVALGDDRRFVDDAELGRNLGYTGKICIHPAQVALAHRVFSPSPADVDHAQRVVAAAAGGVGTVDGEMVDDVHVRMARQILARRRPDPAPPDGQTTDGQTTDGQATDGQATARPGAGG
jgi:citrate lyase subunit beta/citryl-CoA lyase